MQIVRLRTEDGQRIVGERDCQSCKKPFFCPKNQDEFISQSNLDPSEFSILSWWQGNDLSENVAQTFLSGPRAVKKKDTQGKGREARGGRSFG